jgi:hypothetical protein
MREVHLDLLWKFYQLKCGKCRGLNVCVGLIPQVIPFAWEKTDLSTYRQSHNCSCWSEKTVRGRWNGIAEVRFLYSQSILFFILCQRMYFQLFNCTSLTVSYSLCLNGIIDVLFLGLQSILCTTSMSANVSWGSLNCAKSLFLLSVFPLPVSLSTVPRKVVIVDCGAEEIILERTPS